MSYCHADGAHLCCPAAKGNGGRGRSRCWSTTLAPPARGAHYYVPQGWRVAPCTLERLPRARLELTTLTPDYGAALPAELPRHISNQATQCRGANSWPALPLPHALPSWKYRKFLFHKAAVETCGKYPPRLSFLDNAQVKRTPNKLWLTEIHNSRAISPRLAAVEFS